MVRFELTTTQSHTDIRHTQTQKQKHSEIIFLRKYNWILLFIKKSIMKYGIKQESLIRKYKSYKTDEKFIISLKQYNELWCYYKFYKYIDID